VHEGHAGRRWARALGPHDPSDVGGRAVVAVAAGPGAVQPGEEVVLSPHHALRHTGGAARVEHQDVVATALPRAVARAVPAPWTDS